MNGKILGFICPASRNLFGENLYSLFAFEEFCFVNWLLSFGYVVVLRVKTTVETSSLGCSMWEEIKSH